VAPAGAASTLRQPAGPSRGGSSTEAPQQQRPLGVLGDVSDLDVGQPEGTLRVVLDDADSWLMPGGPPPRLRYLETSANGQPALGVYRFEPERNRFLPIALDVLTLRGARIAGITAFRTPEIFRCFGLPDELAA